MNNNIISEIESILYMANSPVELHLLKEFYNLTKEELIEYILKLQELRKDTGINIKLNDNEVYLSTNAVNATVINKFFDIEIKTRKLTKSNMEVLSIILYKGKVTKNEIEKIRGVNSDASVSILLEKNLIYSKERLKTKGNPKLYEVTQDFYKYIGIENIEDLNEIINNKIEFEEDRNEN